MSKEFEKLKALLDLYEPSDRDPQVDRYEAAKLAARWGWLVRRACGQRVERPQFVFAMPPHVPMLGFVSIDFNARPSE
jgi:hypothetical protein